MDGVKVAFFMIVTDRDIVVADYAVRSYRKIQDISFQLKIYSNWISEALKRKYFSQWRQLPYVEIIENEWQTDAKKPADRRVLWGPFELAYTIWDRELKRIEAPYIATVDADFEILDGKFVSSMLERLDANPKLAAISTDYSPKRTSIWDSYSAKTICLNERWHTWFCIYRREALNVPISHAYYEENLPGELQPNVWDDAGYLQRHLKESLGFQLSAVDRAFQGCFIHYGQFSHNKDLNDKNIALYRKLRILRKVGLLGRWDLPTRALALLLEMIRFGHVDRSKFLDGWATTWGKPASTVKPVESKRLNTLPAD